MACIFSLGILTLDNQVYKFMNRKKNIYPLNRLPGRSVQKLQLLMRSVKSKQKHICNIVKLAKPSLK